MRRLQSANIVETTERRLGRSSGRGPGTAISQWHACSSAGLMATCAAPDRYSRVCTDASSSWPALRSWGEWRANLQSAEFWGTFYAKYARITYGFTTNSLSPYLDAHHSTVWAVYVRTESYVCYVYAKFASQLYSPNTAIAYGHI
jgi:hypothetical protein